MEIGGLDHEAVKADGALGSKDGEGALESSNDDDDDDDDDRSDVHTHVYSQYTSFLLKWVRG